MEKKYPHPRDFYVGLLKRNRHVHINGVTYKRVEDLPADLVNETPELATPPRLRPPPVVPLPPVMAAKPPVEPPKVVQPVQPQRTPTLTPNKPKPK